MTLIMSGANSNSLSFLAADRRLVAGGRIYEEDSTKATFICTPDARLAVGFTGIAKYGSFNTQSWLLKSVSDISNNTHYIEEILNRLTLKASKEINASALNLRKEPNLTIIFMGYKYKSTDQSEAVCYRISNFECGGKAKDFVYIDHEDYKFQTAGNTKEVKDKMANKIRKLLNKNPEESKKAITGYTRFLFDKISEEDASNTIGNRINLCLIEKEKNTPLKSIYFASSTRQSIYGPNFLLIGKDGVILEQTMPYLKIHSGPPTVFSPPPRNDNAPCPCGSGLKYKNCHKEIDYPYLPLTILWDNGDDSFSSGKIFKVKHYGAY